MISCHMVKSQILLLCVFFTCICHKTEVFLICLKKGSTYLHRSCSCMHACVLVVVIVCWEMELVSMRLHTVTLLPVIMRLSHLQRVNRNSNSNEIVELGLSCFKLLLLFAHSQCDYGYLQTHDTHHCITLYQFCW